MRLRNLAFGALALVGACARPDPGPTTHVEASQVEQLIHFASDLDGNRISIDGYIGFDNGLQGNAIALGQRLTTSAHGGGEQLIRLDLEQGKGPNQLDLPILKREKVPGMPGAPEILTFDPSNAKFQDAAGAAHGLGEKVRVTGRLRYTRMGQSLVGEEDPRSPTGRRFKPSLVEVTLESPVP